MKIFIINKYFEKFQFTFLHIYQCLKVLHKKKTKQNETYVLSSNNIILLMSSISDFVNN